MNQQQNYHDLSRRQFITLAGGAVGLAALSAMHASNGWVANPSGIDANAVIHRNHETDVLVIGGGIAGLFAAVKAHDAGAKVLLVSKGRLGASGQTPFAKGIFAYDPSNAKMSLDAFTDAVSRSALGTNNPVYTRQMAEQSLARVQELRQWGFFDSIKERGISVKERIVITHLIKEDGRMAGAAGFSLDQETVHFFKAKSVILCTGAGGFKPNGFPICDLTHDGTVMAYNIGAKVTGKEWNDGHPGQATNPAACFDGWHGMFERKPGTTGIGIRHDLGVDINYQAYVSGNPVQMGPPGAGRGNEIQGGPYRPAELDRSGPGGGDGPPGGGRGRGSGSQMRQRPRGGGDGPPGGGRGRGSGSQRAERPRGGGPGNDGGGPPGMGGTSVGGSSAGMSIHKSEGLVPINDQCESNIPGLYAAGDALGSYMAGAIYTQIGSSLAGSAVQGAVAAEAAAQYSKGMAMPAISKNKVNQIRQEMLAPLKKEAGYSPAWVTQTLQGIMIPNFVLYIKKESILKAALAYIEELRDHHLPMLRAADMHELRLAHETGNMIVNAEMKLKASLMRKESRCSHYRLDYPNMDTTNWQAWINIYKGADGSMQLEKQSFDAWPK